MNIGYELLLIILLDHVRRTLEILIN